MEEKRHGPAPPYLEAQDDGPDEAECEAVVAVDDVVRPHVLQVDLLLLEELQRFIHVLQTVDPHATFGGLRLDERGEEKNEKNSRARSPRAERL